MSQGDSESRGIRSGLFSALSKLDKLLLGYLVSIMLFVVFNRAQVAEWRVHLIASASVMLGVLAVAHWNRRRNGRTIRDFVHTFYAIPLLIWLYPETGMLRHVFIRGDLDDTLSRIDLVVFRIKWYAVLPLNLNAGIVEMLHALYFLYYPSLAIFAMLAYARQRSAVQTYVYTLMASMFLHMWFVILFPASGPVALRRAAVPHGPVFGRMMDLIYDNIDQGGGAFPSLHSAGVVIASLFAVKAFPRWAPVLYSYMLGVLLATVACSFHYPIDTVAGVLTGLMSWWWLPRLVTVGENEGNTS